MRRTYIPPFQCKSFVPSGRLVCMADLQKKTKTKTKTQLGDDVYARGIGNGLSETEASA